ncbi:MAG: ferric reductase-like transmembrane domain-containing protein [Mycobacteriaceae bacterium]
MTIALWYSSRATGLASLLLLTAVMVMGAANSARLASTNWPRFTIAALHRNLSLLTVAFLAVHIATAVIDPYAGIGWISVVVPFSSHYSPIWLGLGAVAFDVLLASIITSLCRPWINPRLWRVIHWAAYLCWPVAVAHGLGIGGADTRRGWVLALNGACILVVLAAVGWRANVQHQDTEARRRPFQDAP